MAGVAVWPDDVPGGAEALLKSQLDALLDRLETLARLASSGPLPSELVSDAGDAYTTFCGWFNSFVGVGSRLPPQQRAALGAVAGRRLAPFVAAAPSARRWKTKPRGYAGDDQSIQVIYEHRPLEARCSFEEAMDALFLTMPAAQAVRNRRAILADRIATVYRSARGQREVHVTALAAGPATEVFDAWEQLGRPDDLRAVLVDGDPAAIAALRGRSAAPETQSQASAVLCALLHKANLAHVALGRARLDVPPQDLIYSLGLTDYLPDELVVKLLDVAHDRLRPGGTVIIGNFHSDNHDRACLDHVIEWRLIHRTEADMHKLMAASLFGGPCEDIIRDPTGVQMLAVARKAVVAAL